MKGRLVVISGGAESEEVLSPMLTSYLEGFGLHGERGEEKAYLCSFGHTLAKYLDFEVAHGGMERYGHCACSIASDCGRNDGTS